MYTLYSNLNTNNEHNNSHFNDFHDFICFFNKYFLLFNCDLESNTQISIHDKIERTTENYNLKLQQIIFILSILYILLLFVQQ